MEKKSCESFYEFGAKMLIIDLSVSPDIFSKAIKEGDFSEKRNIHWHLGWGDYLPDTEFPIVFRQWDSDGKKLRDVIPMRFSPWIFLISDRFRSALEENDITGWKMYSAEVYDKKGNPILGYSGFSITGRGGEMEGASSPEWEEICRSRQRKKYDPNQWDGSDIFRIDPAYLVVTKKFRDILIKNKITGVECYPLSDNIDILE